jgi:NodT family efflux transporter outer membrane factor (OMF) lipoprotein
MRIRQSRQGKAASVLTLCLCLSGCASWFKSTPLSPPALPKLPSSFAAPQAAEVSGEAVDRAWWTLFQDPVLDGLQTQLQTGNLNLQLLSAKVRQAQASVAAAQASLWPSVSLNAGASRSVSSAGASASNSVNIGLPLTWELDVWGRIDLQAQAAKANVLASQEDLALARLSAQATLVQTYIALRTAERQQAVLATAQAAYERALTLTRYRYEAGVVSAADVAQAESQWQSAVAQRIEVETTRQQLTHSLSVLLGQAPASLQLRESQALPALPALPTLLPASLLQRRPDVRAGEMRVMAAQAQLGVAQTAFFPTFSFAASTGYKSSELADLFSASSRLWSLGPSLALSLFDGGQRQAVKDDARAALEVAVLGYQQTVLNALQEVEDNLVATHQLQAQELAQAQGLQAAERNLRIAEAQYAAGTVSYLNVVTAQASALTAQRNVLDVQSRRALAVTQLLKNLAGRWDAPSVQQ